ncbi:acyl-CoA dehydrogenase family protein [Streptomyces sp. NPDC096176]|uniref:acyl-CoA dehydrogenase family protein n=1 Tax=Streptomyces sp. NPDC096176 TaxID=3366079 RepID=UPI00382D1EFB
MDAVLTADQDRIRRALRDVLSDHSGPDMTAAARTPAGYDTELWAALAGQLGLPGLALPAQYGGKDRTLTELALAFEETGRVLLPSPLLSTAGLAAPLITALGTPEQRSELLPRIADASLTCALAVPGSLAQALALTGDNTAGDWAGGGRAGGIQARRPGGGWTLYGEAGQVLDGHSARLLLVAAHAGGFPRSRALLFLLDADAAGLTRTRLTTLDETRPQAVLQLRDCPARLLGEDDDGSGVLAALAAAGTGAAALLAAEAAGAAGYTLERTVEHVRARERSGSPTDAVRAVGHRLADLYVHVQAARSAVYYAAVDPGAGPLALAQGLDALRTVAGEAVQLHAGTGSAKEDEAHRYVKRAAADELLLGPAHRLRSAAAERSGLFAPAGTAA